MEKKIKILLLNPPGRKLYLRDHYTSCSVKANYYWHPLDLLIQSGILNKDFEVSVLDAQVLRLNQKKTLKKIITISPDAIFFLCGSANFHNDINFIKSIKNVKNNAKLIGSGDVFRFEAYKVFKKYPFVDAIFTDFTTDGIIKYLHNEYTEYIITAKDGNKINNTNSSKYFSYPVPLYKLFPLKKYKLPFGKQVPFASILTNYGCSFKCIYCNSGNLGFKLREIDNLCEELSFVTSNLNIFKIFFRDMTFTADKTHSLSVCREIKKYKIHWNCYSRPDTIDEEILFAMKEAGCYAIEIGIETGSEEILKKYKPEIKLHEVKKNILLCKKTGIDVIGHFIIGFPEDTEKTIKETLNFALSLPLIGISVNILTPRYGSKFREKCISNNLITSELTWMDNSSSYSVLLNKNLVKPKGYLLLRYYIRPSFILDLIRKTKSVKDIQNILLQGIGIIRNLLGK